MVLTWREKEGQDFFTQFISDIKDIIARLQLRSMFQSLEWQEKRSETKRVRSRKEEGRDSSYRPRIDLWTLPRHQEAKSVSPIFFLFPFAGQRPVSFCLHPVCLPESTVSSLTGSLDAAQMRPQLPLFRRSLSRLQSKSYHTLSGISINAAALIARSSPYYRRAALRPRSYAALAEFIAIPLPPPFCYSPPLRECLRKKHALLENRNRRSR